MITNNAVGIQQEIDLTNVKCEIKKIRQLLNKVPESSDHERTGATNLCWASSLAVVYAYHTDEEISSISDFIKSWEEKSKVSSTGSVILSEINSLPAQLGNIVASFNVAALPNDFTRMANDLNIIAFFNDELYLENLAFYLWTYGPLILVTDDDNKPQPCLHAKVLVEINGSKLKFYESLSNRYMVESLQR